MAKPQDIADRSIHFDTLMYVLVAKWPRHAAHGWSQRTLQKRLVAN